MLTDGVMSYQALARDGQNAFGAWRLTSIRAVADCARRMRCQRYVDCMPEVAMAMQIKLALSSVRSE